MPCGTWCYKLVEVLTFSINLPAPSSWYKPWIQAKMFVRSTDMSNQIAEVPSLRAVIFIAISFAVSDVTKHSVCCLHMLENNTCCRTRVSCVTRCSGDISCMADSSGWAGWYVYEYWSCVKRVHFDTRVLNYTGQMCNYQEIWPETDVCGTLILTWERDWITQWKKGAVTFKVMLFCVFL